MVSIASRTVAPKSAIPALEGLLLEAGKELCLTGYNLKTGIRTVVPADITEEGSLVLSARLFGDIIRRLPDDVVTVATQDYMVNITCGMSEFNILGTDAGEFPELPIVEYQNSLILPQRVLHSMITETIFAVSTNDSRPIHTGELFERTADGLLTVVAVDGYRLALRREGTQMGVTDTACQFVIPASALNEVSKICGDTDETIEIVQGTRHIMFRIDQTTLITRRLEGEFLNYSQAIPADNPIQGNGGELEIGFNNRYLLDALKAAHADTLRINLNTPISPCIIEPEAEGDRNKFLYRVLPVRLKAGQ